MSDSDELDTDDKKKIIIIMDAATKASSTTRPNARLSASSPWPIVASDATRRN